MQIFYGALLPQILIICHFFLFTFTEPQHTISASELKVIHPLRPAKESTGGKPQDELSMYILGGNCRKCTHLLHLSLHTAIDDLLEVTNYLLDFGQTDIYNLGLTLGLNHPHLSKMETSNTFRDNMIAAWLQKEDQVLKMGLPTWETLVKALRTPRVKQTGVASKIAAEKNVK